jgi:hypothetical protein
MLASERDAMAREIMERCIATMQSKSQDYATESNVFSNYTISAEQARISPERVCLVRISEKLSRLGILLDGKAPNHESIDDNMLDIVCTALNMLMIYQKKNV